MELGRRWRRGVGVARAGAAVAVGALVLTGCVRASSGGGGAGSLTVYSGQHVQTTQALVAAFEKQSGIAVNLRSDDEDVLADQIVTEGSHSPADVFYTENSPPLQYLASKNLLADVDPSTLADTPARFNSPDGKWVGVSARVSVMVYNTSLLSPSELPTSVMDLADPKWKGKLAIAGSETDFQPIVTSIAQTHGDAGALRWLEAVKANAAGHRLPGQRDRDGADQPGAGGDRRDQPVLLVPRAGRGRFGRHSIGHCVLRAARPRATCSTCRGRGSSSSSSHKEEAQRFLAFLTSTQGPGDHRPQ